MKKTRIKAESFATREEYLTAVNNVAALEAFYRKVEADYDREVIRLSKRYEAQLARAREDVKGLVLRCEKYALAHREELYPKDTKSAVTTIAAHGFRTNPQSLGLLSKWTWKEVLKRLQLLHIVDCIRVKPEVDKEAALKMAKEHGCLRVTDPDHDNAAVEIPLAKCGLRLEQEEIYFIEPKGSSAETVKASEAKKE